METPEMDTTKATISPELGKTSSYWKWLGRIFRFCLLLAIVGVGTGVSYHWLANPPVTQRRPPKPESVKVEIMTVKMGPEQVIVNAMGTVVPAHEVKIAARVSGQIVEVSPHFEPGGKFGAGEAVLSIDRKDYELAVQQQTGNLTKAQSDVKLEMGQQAVAKREYEILGETAEEDDEELLLRQPQLASKQASVSVAEAMLDKARLDLERTKVVAPFSALVQTRTVDLGAYVAPGTPLATLVGTDAFWIEVSVPVDELGWIDIPVAGTGVGPRARVSMPSWGNDYREGYVTRLLGDVEPQGRMARLIVTIEDPLALNVTDGSAKPLLLGSFVRVEISGKEMQSVACIPRTALRDGTRVWVMANDNTLDIRDADVAWSSADRAYVSSGLSEGDMLVVSDLPTPVQGLSLRTGDETGHGSSVPPQSAEKTGSPA